MRGGEGNGEKQGRAPNVAQKKQIEAAGLNSRDWLVLIESVNQLYLVHKGTGESRTVKKGEQT